MVGACGRGRRRTAARVAGLAVALVAATALAACEPPGTDCNPAIYKLGANLAGTDQRGKDLHRCNLSLINFTGADFTGADLGNASLDGANLTNATFAGADVHNAILHIADTQAA